MDQIKTMRTDLPDVVTYAKQFKALSDPIRLTILHLLAMNGKSCVCDLEDILELPQSKLSYHLKILLNNGLIHKEISKTWSYYWVDEAKTNELLSEQFCYFLKSPDDDCC
ncbi:ArsR/SmtB family transcription factor [Marinilactibacillus kalidii]|uniref:ArsR/SmtB family transcription factor n=1 Tax=Marinilactibacillus kalidii TaxID=2820274 RepID=UPI001ABE0977|nr:metalloregulator ArsR/SmtB family transcription factor [Marinilactibacillus kalidii]